VSGLRETGILEGGGLKERVERKSGKERVGLRVAWETQGPDQALKTVRDVAIKIYTNTNHAGGVRPVRRLGDKLRANLSCMKCTSALATLTKDSARSLLKWKNYVDSVYCISDLPQPNLS